MGLKFGTIGLCAAIMGALALTSPSADAQTQKKKKQDVANQSQVTAAGRPRARVTVERRSFLDAGTAVQPGERKFTDYAFPPGHSPLQALGPGRDFRRQPLNDPWDVPGMFKF